MRNHTTNLAERAASIADREAEEACRKTGSSKEYPTIWLSVYRQSLLEFMHQASINK